MAFAAPRLNGPHAPRLNNINMAALFSPAQARASAHRQMVVVLTETVGKQMIAELAKQGIKQDGKKGISCSQTIVNCLFADKQTRDPSKLHKTMSKAAEWLMFDQREERYTNGKKVYVRIVFFGFSQEKLKTYGLDNKSSGSEKPWECKDFVRVIFNFIKQAGIEKMFEAYMKAHKVKVTPEAAKKFAQDCIVAFAGKK